MDIQSNEILNDIFSNKLSEVSSEEELKSKEIAKLSTLSKNLGNVNTGMVDATSSTKTRFILYAAGSNIIWTANTERSGADTSYTLCKEIILSGQGTITVDFDLKVDNAAQTAYGKIYKNDSAVGTERSTTGDINYHTFSENISVVRGDRIQLYVKTTASNWFARNFKIKISGSYDTSRVVTD